MGQRQTRIIYIIKTYSYKIIFFTELSPELAVSVAKGIQMCCTHLQIEWQSIFLHLQRLNQIEVRRVAVFAVIVVC